MATPKPRSEPPSSPDTKTRILTGARALIIEAGVEALSMRRVAERARVGTMTTYRHFSDKDDLLGHLVVEGFHRFRDHFYRALEGQSPFERLRLCGVHYLGFALAFPKDYELMFMSTAGASARPPDAREQVASAQRFLVDRVRECHGDNPQETALTLWSHCHGLVSLHLGGRYDPDLDFPRFYDNSTRAVLAGLGFTATNAGMTT